MFLAFQQTSLIGKTFARSDLHLGEFKGKHYPTIWLRSSLRLRDPALLTRGSAGAIVNHVATQCQDQGRLLEEAKRDLEVFKKAYYKAEREMHDREERFEQEKQALSDEIHQLKVRLFPLTFNTKSSATVSSCPTIH